MTRKDYVMIARVVKDQLDQVMTIENDQARVEARITLYDLADSLCGELKADNPRFETSRFMTACGF